MLLVLNSGGGTVTGYGLAAAQLTRIKAAGLRLTVCVEQAACAYFPMPRLHMRLTLRADSRPLLLLEVSDVLASLRYRPTRSGLGVEAGLRRLMLTDLDTPYSALRPLVTTGGLTFSLEAEPLHSEAALLLSATLDGLAGALNPEAVALVMRFFELPRSAWAAAADIER